MKPNYIGAIIVFLAVFFVAAPLLGVAGVGWFGVPLAAFLAIAVVFGLGYFGVAFVALGFSKTVYLAVAAIGLIAVFFGGGFGGLPSAGLLPPSADEARTSCQQLVSEELRGKSADLILNGYDAESNTPFASNTDVPYRLYQNGALATSGTVTIADSVSTAGITVGDVISLYGGNATHYMDAIVNLCIEKESTPIEITARKVVGESDMAITGYDDTGTTALDTPDGTYSTWQEDYEFDMGADDEQSIYIKFKTNVANEVHQLGAICTKGYEGVADTIDAITLMEPGWSADVVPKYLANTVLCLNDTTTVQTSNTTDGYEECWRRDAGPLLLHEWDSIKFQYTIETGSGTIAEDDDATPTASTLVIIGHFDSAWARGDDGKEHLDYYAHTSAKANVGLVENLYSPLGKETAVIIELK